MFYNPAFIAEDVFKSQANHPLFPTWSSHLPLRTPLWIFLQFIYCPLLLIFL